MCYFWVICAPKPRWGRLCLGTAGRIFSNQDGFYALKYKKCAALNSLTILLVFSAPYGSNISRA